MKYSFFCSVSTSSKLLQLTESVEGLDSGPWCTIGYAIFPEKYICRPESKLRRAIVCIRYRMMNFFKSISLLICMAAFAICLRYSFRLLDLRQMK